uniref:EGF-like domain-containing protein n=1 Tax=Timema monikensis TaxID=170555 RepID=A0A7R9E339_9NEOP|nr:unnamed protein product [Timema monikensis]
MRLPGTLQIRVPATDLGLTTLPTRALSKLRQLLATAAGAALHLKSHSSHVRGLNLVCDTSSRLPRVITFVKGSGRKRMNLCVVPEREWGSSRGNLAPSEAIRASSRTCLPIEDGVEGGWKGLSSEEHGGRSGWLNTASKYRILPPLGCTAMYVGEYCQHLNPCHTGPGPRCQNGGSCHVRASTTSSPSFWCTCPIGYSASLCEIPVANSCDSDPCLNGGTCALISLDKYTCTCSPGYTGKDYHPHSGHDISSVPQHRCIGCAARTQARAIQNTKLARATAVRCPHFLLIRNLISNTSDKIKSFRVKLDLWSTQISNGLNEMFPNVKEAGTQK